MRIYAADRKQRKLILRPLGGPALFLAHVMVSATKKKQRLAFVRFKMLHAADIERVVASGMNVENFHHKICHRSADQAEGRCDAHSEHAGPATGRPSEMIAKRVLILSQHADAEAPHLGQDAVHIGTIVERNQDQRRIERNGNERVGRHAVRLFLVLGSEDGDARWRNALMHCGTVGCQSADDAHHLRPFFITTLMSLGLMRSGTVQPSRSYSAMHCSANPLYFADCPN